MQAAMLARCLYAACHVVVLEMLSIHPAGTPLKLDIRWRALCHIWLYSSTRASWGQQHMVTEELCVVHPLLDARTTFFGRAGSEYKAAGHWPTRLLDIGTALHRVAAT